MPDSLWQDVRFAARSLRLNPGYAGIALLTLAVGIGANAAIFSVVNAYLLRPLPLEEPNRIISLSKVKDGNTGPTSAPNFLDYREQSSSFEDLVGIQLWATTLTGVDTPRRLSLAMVTPGFFQVLGAQPTLGRGFVSEESIEGQRRSVVLSHEAWSSSFGSDVTVLGRSVLLNGESYELVGVAPRGLRVPPFTSDVYVPLAFADDALDARGRNNIFVLGRLADGASMASASAEMDVIAQGLSDTYPRANEGWGIRLEELHTFAVGSSPRGLWMLLGAVGLVLLIACVNVASLTVARGAARSRELAVRVALGASRARLLRQLLGESILLALLGGAMGVGLAYALLDPIVSLVPARVSGLGEVSIDSQVLLFTLGVSVLTGLLSGLTPAYRMSGLASASQGPSGVAERLTNRGGSERVRDTLVVSEFALAMVLLVGAGLFIRSLSNLYSVDLGVDHEGVTSFQVSFADAEYPAPADVTLGVDRLLEELAARPEVKLAAATSHLPLSGARLSSSVLLEAGPQEHSVNSPSAAIKVVTPGYFSAMGIPLLTGRLLTWDDEPGGELVVVVNRTAAESLWPGEEPIGEWISYAEDADEQPIRRRVVGVIGDVHFAGPSRPATSEIYQSHRQTIEVWRWFGRGMSYVARTRDGSTLELRAVQETLASVDPNLPVVGLSSLTEVLDTSVATRRFQGTLVGLFAGLALLLAAVDTYGVMAFSVRQRTREIGIRVAMGAQRQTLLRSVLSDGLRLAAIGTVVGAIGAAAVSRSVSSLLWGVEGTDPMTYVSVAAVLAGATVMATLVPALRASRIDPVVALRAE